MTDIKGRINMNLGINIASGMQSFAVGHNCHAKHDHSILVGKDLESKAPYQIVFGSKNNHVTLTLNPEEWEIISTALLLALNIHKS